MSDEPPDSPVSDLMRIAAGVAGVGVIATGATASAGAVLTAALGVWIAAIIGNARRRPLVRGTAWVVACATATVYLGLGGALLMQRAQDGTFVRAKVTEDSIAAAQPQPAWADKIGGKVARDGVPTMVSGAVATWAMVVGGVLALALMGTVAGTCGWAAAMLMTLAAAGRWMPRRRNAPESPVT